MASYLLRQPRPHSGSIFVLWPECLKLESSAMPTSSSQPKRIFCFLFLPGQRPHCLTRPVRWPLSASAASSPSPQPPYFSWGHAALLSVPCVLHAPSSPGPLATWWPWPRVFPALLPSLSNVYVLNFKCPFLWEAFFSFMTRSHLPIISSFPLWTCVILCCVHYPCNNRELGNVNPILKTRKLEQVPCLRSFS